MDDVPAVFSLGPVAAIKIDIEGMEGLALLGMRAFLERAKVPFVMVEVSNLTLKNKWDEAVAMMHSMGYKLYSIVDFPPEKSQPVPNSHAALQNAYFYLGVNRL